MLPEQLNSLLFVLIVSCSFQPVGPVISKFKAFLATGRLISVIQYTSDLLLEKESRTHMISEFWKTSDHCFYEAPVQGSTRKGWPLLYQGLTGRGALVRHCAEGRPQHPAAGKHGEW